ncbi:MAG: chemotaxis protein CheA [Deltaproteobacteria bacterium]|nr:chemotaxis protein CheA [Deltaproteobacteria bacterium]
MSAIDDEAPYARFLRLFLEECAEYVSVLETGLLELERTPGDRETLDAVFRAAHSMKGGGAALGLAELSEFTHVMENVLDEMREGRLLADGKVISALLQAVDGVKALLAAAQGGAPADAEFLADIAARLTGVRRPTTAPLAGVAEAPNATVDADVRTYIVEFAPDAGLFRAGLDSLLLLRDLAGEAITYDVQINTDAVPPLSKLDPESCYCSWAVKLETTATIEQLVDVFAFAGGDTVARVRLESATVAAPAAILARPETVRAPAEPAVTKASSIRVATQKLDGLIDVVGELIIAQAMLKDVVAKAAHETSTALQQAVREIERSTRDLQERVMGVRMLPVNTVFSRFPRMVRDLAIALGKEVDFVMEGGDIELDKTVIDLIGDPLTHLLRNALDHGIEAPAARVAAGKPAKATLTLKAYHDGGSVVVSVQDDGRGLDLDRIRAKALSRGLVEEGQPLTQAEITDLIFAPGFSTAETVSDVSGRGVGMDVVKRSVQALNGSLGVDSDAGKGACFFVILPLTLAILDGLAVHVGQQVYILPLLSVVQSFRPSRNDTHNVLGQDDLVSAFGQTLPLVRLGHLFAVPEYKDNPCDGLVIVVEHAGHQFALLVDGVRGRSQVVMKSLEVNFKRVAGTMGATILGDGHVALILDVKGLSRLARLPSALHRTNAGANPRGAALA